MSKRVSVPIAPLLAAALVAGCGATATPSMEPAASVGPVPTSAASAAPSSSPPPASVPPATAAPSLNATGPAVAYEPGAEIIQVEFGDDGRTAVVQLDWTADRAAVALLDEWGSLLPGWPWSVGDVPGPRASARFGPDGSVYVQVRAHDGPDTWRQFLHRLDASGREMPGFPIGLPGVPFCSLDVAATGVAYVTCENEDDTGTGRATVMAIRPDGGTVGGWPVTLDGSAAIAGFRPDGVAVITTGRDETLVTSLAPDGSVVSGWPQRVAGKWALAYAGGVIVDADGRVHVTTYDWAEGQCGAAQGTTYTVLGLDGRTLAGWPVTRDGWASEPAVQPDGSMTVVTEHGRAIRYGLDANVVEGWPVTEVDVSVDCYAGSPVVAAGNDGTIVVGDREVTLLADVGRVATGWPVDPDGRLISACEACTPGPSGPMRPAVGDHGVFVVTHHDDEPLVAGTAFDGAMPDAAQVAIGGGQVEWVRIGATGRVWVLLTDWSNELDSSSSRLVPVAEDAALAR